MPVQFDINSARVQLIEQARSHWIAKLIDKSRRNNLLYFQHLTTSTLDLSAARFEILHQFLAGEVVPLADFFPEEQLAQTISKIREIKRKALVNLEEKGLETLFMTVGLATWPASDNGRPPSSPVLMIPLDIQSRGREGKSFLLTRSGDIQINPVLIHFLQDDLGFEIPPDQIGDLLENQNDSPSPELIFREIQNLFSKLQGFAIQEAVAVANFSFQKMAMVVDIQNHLEEMVNHDVIAAVAGDDDARLKVSARRREIDARSLDLIPAANEFIIRDTDSSQKRVIAAVSDGQDGVIEGPPGTGKSQTIANLIATLVAKGKRVLFVAEKRAALDVVLTRLQEAELSHLALDLHGADVSRKRIADQLSSCLAAIRHSHQPSADDLFIRYEELRQRLNEHAEKMNQIRQPSGMSLFDMQGQLLSIPPEAQSSTRWWKEQLGSMNQQYTQRVIDLFVELQGYEALFLRDETSAPWSGAIVQTAEESQQAYKLVASMHSKLCPEFLSELWRVTNEVGLPYPHLWKEVQDIAAVLHSSQEIFGVFAQDIVTLNLDNVIATLLPCEKRLSTVKAYLVNSSFRNALKNVRGLWIGRKSTAKNLLNELRHVNIACRSWNKISNAKNRPSPVSDLHRFVVAFQAFAEALLQLQQVFPERNLTKCTLDELSSLFNKLSNDSATPITLPFFCGLEDRLNSLGVQDLVVEIRNKKISSTYWKRTFQYAWFSSCIENVRASDNTIAGFTGTTHNQFAEEFKYLDRKRINATAARVRHLHANHAIATMNKFPSQEGILRREAERTRRHLPLRKLIKEAPDVLTAICPCWMASPLSISQVIDASRCYFDVVIFDEASQVLPEDAIPAFLRASRVVVAGDRRQLPPTTFFVAGDDEIEEEYTATQGFESILDQMSTFLTPWPLLWHYRSKDERLIGFSNYHIYGNSLVTFPTPSFQNKSISHVLVNAEPNTDFDEDSSAAEVRTVVKLIIDHAEQRPSESLGVIALGIKHQRRIEASLERELLLRPALDPFFNQSKEERFFVKNLERVQGDERDAILLSIGYGKDRSGKLLYRFGPLLYEGGERRLNVAITRARLRLTLVSSFSHHEMDPNRTQARGVELLRLYLQYASSDGTILSETGKTEIALNPFEIDVYQTLQDKGIKLVPQYGISRFRIDFGVQHPDEPGRFIMALECDGAKYHSSPIAMERDRLRQQHLEALGWKFYRIWSTDWFMRKAQEVERFLRSYEVSLRRQTGDFSSAHAAARNFQNPVHDEPTAEIISDRQRHPRPPMQRGLPIDDYSDSELKKILLWIESDGQLRTDEQLLEEAITELGFQRRGTRIVERLNSVITRLHGM